MSTIYLDNAATTQISPTVLDAMLPYLKDQYGNPSSNYSLGIKARKAKEAAREKVASLINAYPDEIFFTSGATESNNWILSAVLKEFEKTGAIMISNVEHSSVLKCAEALTKNRYMIVSCDENSRVHPQALQRKYNHIAKRTIIVSVMMANNETGVINDVKGLSDIAHEYNTIFHTDATQALPHMRVDVKQLGIDALSGTAHKMYGPKGIGFLYVSKKSDAYEILQRHPMILGGHQESGLRAGTENIPGIIGLGAACEETRLFLEKKSNEGRLHELKKSFYDYLNYEIGVVSNVSDFVDTLPVLNLRVPGVNNHELIQFLDEEQVCVSAGSACNENEKSNSHVLTAMMIKDDRINESIRISIGRNNTEKDIKDASEIIVDKVKTLRMFSE